MSNEANKNIRTMALKLAAERGITVDQATKAITVSFATALKLSGRVNTAFHVAGI